MATSPETSLFSCKLNPNRTELLINGYCTKDRYFQIIPLEIIKLIILYFNHIVYFNIKNNILSQSKIDRLDHDLTDFINFDDFSFLFPWKHNQKISERVEDESQNIYNVLFGTDDQWLFAPWHIVSGRKKIDGIFRWQNAHGFKIGQHRGLQHLKQKYSNIKELSYFNKQIIYLLCSAFQL